MPPPLPPEVFDALPPAVQYDIRCLEALAGQVVTLTARVAELEDRLKQDSCYDCHGVNRHTWTTLAAGVICLDILTRDKL